MQQELQELKALPDPRAGFPGANGSPGQNGAPGATGPVGPTGKI